MRKTSSFSDMHYTEISEVILEILVLLNDEFPQLMLNHENVKIVCRKSGRVIDNSERLCSQLFVAGMELELKCGE